MNFTDFFRYQYDYFIPILVVGIGYYLYARMIKRKNKALEALASIDVQLERRGALIPNIIKLAKHYMCHEKDLLEEVSRLRTKVSEGYDKLHAKDVKNHLEAAESLQGKMTQIIFAFESYPELASDKLMLEAQNAYREVDANLAAARRFYNSAVADLNNSITVFPGPILAALAGIQALPMFKVSETFKENIDVDAIFS